MTRGEDISAEYVALEAKRNAFGELKKLLVSPGDAMHTCQGEEGGMRMGNCAHPNSDRREP